ncbi:MAG: hypothetical protein IJA85_03970 [Clostridia bacterium]|nr:hypothetical protein [Clostridia bacterium]
MKRTATLLLALLLAASSIMSVSCSESDKTDGATTTAAPVDTTPVETEEPRIEPDLPDITFDGADIKFYQYRNSDTYPYFHEIWVEDQNGEPINDAVYKRNSLIEERYQTKITFTEDEYITFMNNVKKNVSASENVHDVILPMGHCVAHMYTSNVFYNLHAIEYLDFEKPWWDQDALEAFTLADYMPFAVSDLLVNAKSVTSTVLFNKKLADDYQVGNLYDEVYNNTWTIETMINKGKMVSEDLNGDSNYDDEDRYGIVCGDDPVTALFASVGGRIVSKDADGYPVLSFANEYNYTAIQYYLENLMYDERLTRNNSFVPNSKGSTDMFKDNQGLFLFGSLSTTQSMREMEADFGVLPVPKYTVEQDYACSVSPFAGSLIAVPITTQNTEMIGVIVEAMSAESKYTVVPALYDTVFKDKSTRDEESVDMLDIIFDSMTFDVGDYYGLAGFQDVFLRITGSVYENNVDKSYPQQTSDIASFYAKHEKKLNKALEDLIETIDEWKGM